MPPRKKAKNAAAYKSEPSVPQSRNAVTTAQVKMEVARL